MKITGRGIVTIIVFFILLPLFIELILLFFTNSKTGSISLTSFLLSAYVTYLPWYLVYLVLAAVAIYLWKKYHAED